MKANFHCAHLHNLSPQGTGDVPTALLGAQTASLYGWRTSRGLRQQRSCGFLCGDEPAFTQGFAKGLLARCFFRKPTSPPLNLKRFSKTHQSSLTLKGGSTSSRSSPLREEEETAPLNSLYDPFGSPYRGQKRCSNRYAIRLADHQRSTPAAELRIFVRDKPQGHTMLDACSMLMEPQGHTNRCLMLIARNLLGLLLMGTQGHE